MLINKRSKFNKNYIILNQFISIFQKVYKTYSRKVNTNFGISLGMEVSFTPND